jgi:hypothetical protein
MEKEMTDTKPTIDEQIAYLNQYYKGGTIDTILASLEELKRIREVHVPEFTLDQFNRAAEIVGPMDGYDGSSPDADHFNWLNAILRAAGEQKSHYCEGMAEYQDAKEVK